MLREKYRPLAHCCNIIAAKRENQFQSALGVLADTENCVYVDCILDFIGFKSVAKYCSYGNDNLVVPFPVIVIYTEKDFYEEETAGKIYHIALSDYEHLEEALKISSVSVWQTTAENAPVVEVFPDPQHTTGKLAVLRPKEREYACNTLRDIVTEFLPPRKYPRPL